MFTQHLPELPALPELRDLAASVRTVVPAAIAVHVTDTTHPGDHGRVWELTGVRYLDRAGAAAEVRWDFAGSACADATDLDVAGLPDGLDDDGGIVLADAARPMLDRIANRPDVSVELPPAFWVELPSAAPSGQRRKRAARAIAHLTGMSKMRAYTAIDTGNFASFGLHARSVEQLAAAYASAGPAPRGLVETLARSFPGLDRPVRYGDRDAWVRAYDAGTVVYCNDGDWSRFEVDGVGGNVAMSWVDTGLSVGCSDALRVASALRNAVLGHDHPDLAGSDRADGPGGQDGHRDPAAGVSVISDDGEVGPGGAVRLRFEASSVDDGDIFLYQLAVRGVLAMADYRADRWWVKGDVLEVPAGRADEVRGLPDELELELDVWDDD